MELYHLTTLVSLLVIGITVESSHVGYTEIDGPHTWTGVCQSGTRQSPVNIVASSVVWDPDLPRVHFANYGTGGPLTVTNDGHSISVTGFENWGKDRPYIYGGALKGEYELQSFHFHWGQTNGTGSEHTLGGLHYSGEIHFVHRKRGLPENAILQSDSIAVLGVFIGLGTKSNSFRSFETSFKTVQKTPGQSVAHTSGYVLMDLFPTSLETFYTYEGSLTTPGCNEVVIWTVFSDPVSITLDQLNIFRQTIITHDQKPGSNYRPTQPLNGRKIRFRPAAKVSSQISASVINSVLGAILVILFSESLL